MFKLAVYSVFQLHVCLILVNDAAQCTIAHIFQNTDAVSEREGKEEHFQHEADVQAIMRKCCKRQQVKVHQRTQKEAGKQYSICNYKEPGRAIATTPHGYTRIKDE